MNRDSNAPSAPSLTPAKRFLPPRRRDSAACVHAPYLPSSVLSAVVCAVLTSRSRVRERSVCVVRVRVESREDRGQTVCRPAAACVCAHTCVSVCAPAHRSLAQLWSYELNVF